ncbi:hypothetical protein B4N89_45160 [Embleya scabrispora]|uniref:Uncharacterized protein n=1 Tax=Embleya scabrispora TaxID=159449 RepID=A0A1T3NJ85_9ACTN|nr:hypothetical protein [Embleya scabrispora]OPC76681.1 hypothetical protein B4N89_45160 [Embleya scabrispora]
MAHGEPAQPDEVLRALRTADHTHTLSEISAGVRALRGQLGPALSYLADLVTVVERLTDAGRLVGYSAGGTDVWGLEPRFVVGDRVTRIGGGSSGADGRVGTVTAAEHNPEHRAVHVTMRYEDATVDGYVSPRLLRRVQDASCSSISYSAEVLTDTGWQSASPGESWTNLNDAFGWARTREGAGRVRLRSTDGQTWERFPPIRHAFTPACLLPPAWEGFAVPVDRQTSHRRLNATFEHLNANLTDDLRSGFVWLTDHGTGRGWEMRRHPWQQWAMHGRYRPPEPPIW